MLIDREKLQEAKEKLGLQNAEILQDLYQMDKWDPRALKGCCPNPNHEDSTPSCSYDPKLHRLKCFGCGWTSDVPQALITQKGMTFVDACTWICEQAGVPFDHSNKGRKTHGKDFKYPKPVYAKDKKTVKQYWGNRNISGETIDYLGIQQDKDGNTLFEYYDLNDVLVDVKVRLSSNIVPEGKSKCWHLVKGNKSVNVLYNMNKIVPNQTLIITSGEGDCATAIECGFVNAVSINGGDTNTQWIGECWEWLEQFPDIILVHDNDDSGRKFAKEVSKRLGEYRVKIAEIPEVPRVDALTGEVATDANGDPLLVNDLNDLLCVQGKEAVIEVLMNAREAEIPAIIDYTDVKRFDMSDVDGFTTGIKSLDIALTKFYMGSTTILTGAPGSGKTSFLSTLICQAVEQEFPTFVYSGELSNPSLKSWIDFVHAGRWGIQEYENTKTKTKYYRVTTDAFQDINNAYRGNIYFYKDTMSQKVGDLLQTAENVVRRYGVKFLVFDNMSSVDLEANDENKWHKQEDFIREIISFSTRWNVCCCVVLHPKKVQSTRITSLYDLSGVVASANLSHRVLSLYRVSKKDKQGVRPKGNGCEGKFVVNPIDHDVLIDVLKDRFGSGLGHVAGVFYDVPSKRFYETNEDLFFQYRWDKQDHSGEPLIGGIPTRQRIEEEENREIFGAPLPQ